MTELMGVLLLALLRCESEDECQAIAEQFEKAAKIEWCADKEREK